MKKIMFSIVLFCMSLLFADPTPVQPTGSGSSGDPYLVASLENLFWITQNASSWSSYFVQTVDIDATSSSEWSSGWGMIPIGNNSTKFTGSYNGQDHYIDGIFISRSTLEYVSLFGNVFGGEISNLGVTNVNITGKYNVGALVGYSSNYSTIQNCYSSGSVQGTGYVGGLVGTNYFSSTVSNSFSHASVTGSSDYIAGLVGNNYSATISNSYSTGSVVSPSITGGLAASGGTSTVLNSFWDTETSGQATSYGGTGKTTAEMKTESTFTDAGWDFAGESANGNDDIWSMDGSTNDGYPYLTNNTPPEVPTPITLVSFCGKERNGSIEITWETATEANNACFLIYRNGEVIGSVDGAGTSSESHTYAFVDNAVVPGVLYCYTLADIDYANNETRYEHKAVTVMLDNDVSDADFVIGDAYPNPFNPQTTINYMLSSDRFIEIDVFNCRGENIANLFSGFKLKGSYSINWNAGNVPSGVFMIRAFDGISILTQKVILLK